MTVAFAMSGGANLGPMQAGAVMALLEGGVVPDLLVGTSVGALNAAYLSTRPGLRGAQSLRTAWTQLRRHDVASLNPIGLLAGFLGFRDYLLSADRLRATIRRWIEIERLEEATTPLHVVATDALNGQPVVLQSGEVLDAVSASAAIPGLLPPVRIGGRWLVDGTLSAGCPVLQAQELGADTIYMITTATAPRARTPRGALAMAMNSVSLATAQTNQGRLEAALAHASRHNGRVHVVPSGLPEAPGPFDLSRTPLLAETAYRSAKSWLESTRDPASRPAPSGSDGAARPA